MSGVDSHQTIAQLQSILMRSVLNQQPLPGQTAPIRFPDLAFILEAATVLVSDENVPDEFDAKGLGKPVEIIPEQEIRRKAAAKGDMPYVYFQPAEQTEKEVRLVMEVRMALKEPHIEPLGLGAISTTFVRIDHGDWQVISTPMVIAM